MRPIGADTSPPGKSHSSSVPSSAQRSDHSENQSEDFGTCAFAPADPKASTAPHSIASKENVMSKTSATRRGVLATSAAAGAASLLPAHANPAMDETNTGAAIRRFRVNIPEAELVELRRR